MQIPVIDLGPYLAGDPGARAQTAQALAEASETLGFYFLANHGVPQGSARPNSPARTMPMLAPPTPPASRPPVRDS